MNLDVDLAPQAQFLGYVKCTWLSGVLVGFHGADMDQRMNVLKVIHNVELMLKSLDYLK